MKRLLIASIFLGSMAIASPAFPGSVTFTNSDGSTFSGKINGNPFFHYIRDTNGKIIVYNSSSKNFEYADYDTNNNKLVPSGVKAGLNPGTYGNISNTQIQVAWANANSAVSQLNQPLLFTLIANKTFYEVTPAHNGVSKMLYRVGVNGSVTNINFTRIEPSQLETKNNSVHISGNKVINDSNQSNSYMLFSQKNGYLEVKKYIKTQNGNYELEVTKRWFVNQSDATNYYNSI